MTRKAVMIGGVALWLACLGAAILWIIPLSAMGLAAIFSGGTTVVERLQGLGFLVLGLIVVSLLLVALTRISRSFSKASHAQN
jgi:hypothetical protein